MAPGGSVARGSGTDYTSILVSANKYAGYGKDTLHQTRVGNLFRDYAYVYFTGQPAVQVSGRYHDHDQSSRGSKTFVLSPYAYNVPKSVQKKVTGWDYMILQSDTYRKIHIHRLGKTPFVLYHKQMRITPNTTTRSVGPDDLRSCRVIFFNPILRAGGRVVKDRKLLRRIYRNVSMRSVVSVVEDARGNWHALGYASGGRALKYDSILNRKKFIRTFKVPTDNVKLRRGEIQLAVVESRLGPVPIIYNTRTKEIGFEHNKFCNARERIWFTRKYIKRLKTAVKKAEAEIAYLKKKKVVFPREVRAQLLYRINRAGVHGAWKRNRERWITTRRDMPLRAWINLYWECYDADIKGDYQIKTKRYAGTETIDTQEQYYAGDKDEPWSMDKFKTRKVKRDVTRYHRHTYTNRFFLVVMPASKAIQSGKKLLKAEVRQLHDYYFSWTVERDTAFKRPVDHLMTVINPSYIARCVRTYRKRGVRYFHHRRYHGWVRSVARAAGRNL